MNTEGWAYQLGDKVYKKSGSEWQGKIVGFYSSSVTPRGYVVESQYHVGSTQIYPESALKTLTQGPTTNNIKI